MRQSQSSEYLNNHYLRQESSASVHWPPNKVGRVHVVKRIALLLTVAACAVAQSGTAIPMNHPAPFAAFARYHAALGNAAAKLTESDPTSQVRESIAQRYGVDQSSLSLIDNSAAKLNSTMDQLGRQASQALSSPASKKTSVSMTQQQITSSQMAAIAEFTTSLQSLPADNSSHVLSYINNEFRLHVSLNTSYANSK